MASLPKITSRRVNFIQDYQRHRDHQPQEEIKEEASAFPSQNPELERQCIPEKESDGIEKGAERHSTSNAAAEAAVEKLRKYVEIQQVKKQEEAQVPISQVQAIIKAEKDRIAEKAVRICLIGFGTGFIAGALTAYLIISRNPEPIAAAAISAI